MQIFANIKKIEYKPKLYKKLNEYKFDKFNINNSPAVFKLKIKDSIYSISKWVSPKRTRSYPYARIYNSLIIPKKITIIPVIKDEGIRGDRDFLQWDTISLMSLLDVYVILAYYNKAQKSDKKNKITKQEFDNEYIKEQINKINNFHSSALHWNVEQLDNIETLIEKAKQAYKNISNTLKVIMHNENGIDKFLEKIKKSLDEFKNFSREKAKQAQYREINTIQPKEHLSSNEFQKAKITITNYLGGEYFFTCDEVKIVDNDIYLIESKHTNNSVLPSSDDIKDGILKMILYTNLENVTINNITYNPIPTIKLTSKKINLQKNIDLFIDLKTDSIKNLVKILKEKNPTINDKFLTTLFEEAIENNFNIVIQKV